MSKMPQLAREARLPTDAYLVEDILPLQLALRQMQP